MAPICLTTVPIEFKDAIEFDRVADPVFEDEVPIGMKFKLELSSATKLGLDGGPMGITFGLESLDIALCRPEGPAVGESGDDGSETTALIVGASVGNTAISSSEDVADFSRGLCCNPCAGEMGSGYDDRLEPSHICDDERPASKIDGKSHRSAIDCSTVTEERVREEMSKASETVVNESRAKAWP